MILDTLHRLPFAPLEALEPWAGDVMKLLMEMVRSENEENAVLCMKTIMDFQRNYQQQLAEQVQPFLNLIMDMFGQMPKAVKDTFDIPATTGATPAMPSTPGNTQQFQSPRPSSPLGVGGDPVADPQQPAKMLTKGMQSFKVLAECPIIVVSLFQAHRNSVPKNVKLFVPLIKEMLQLQAGPQREAHEAAKRRGENFTGVSANIKNRAAFGEFVTAQVKVRESAVCGGCMWLIFVVDYELLGICPARVRTAIDGFPATTSRDRCALAQRLSEGKIGGPKGKELSNFRRERDSDM